MTPTPEMRAEEARAFARLVAEIDARRDLMLREISPPASADDYEREHFQRRYVCAVWEREREDPWRNLLNWLSAEVREGFIEVNPIELRHVEKAREMVAEARKELE